MQCHEKDHKAFIAFHIPIPDENTTVSNISLRTALISHLPSTVSAYPLIQGAEQTQLDNGELYEHATWVEYDGNKTPVQKQAAMDDRYTALASSILDKIRNELKYYGRNRNVP